MRGRILLILTVVFLSIRQLSAQVVPEATGSQVSREEAQIALDFHNKARSDVGTPALEWSAKLSAFAQQWADHLASTGCKLKHRPGEGEMSSPYGENIFGGSGGQYSALHASETWYSEIRDYVHEVRTSDNWYTTGHYTQMVWKKTTQMGIGVARCENGGMIIVANYDPPGNYMGEIAY